MADDWDVELEGDDEMKARLRAFASLLLDLRPFWPKVIPLFIGWEAEQFASEGAYWGTPWAPLSPEYAARKAITHPGKGILIADGDLRRGASLPARRATRTSLTLTITWRKKKRAAMDPGWHQYGTKNMPARPLLGPVLPPRAQLELDNAANEYIEEMARRVGLI